MGIMDDELDIDMAQSKEDKDNALRSKASKIWRILRLSSRNKLAAFDKIDDGKNLKALFETPSPPSSEKGAGASQTQTQTPAPEQAQTQEQTQEQVTEQVPSQERTSAPENAPAPAPEQAPGEVAIETTEDANSGNTEQGQEPNGGEAAAAEAKEKIRP